MSHASLMLFYAISLAYVKFSRNPQLGFCFLCVSLTFMWVDLGLTSTLLALKCHICSVC